MVEILLYILSNFFDVCVWGGGLFIEPAFFLVGGFLEIRTVLCSEKMF